MDINNILQDEKKKKYIIIGAIALFVIIAIIFLFTRPQTNVPSDDQSGQTQLLNDISQLTPRDGVSQGSQNLVSPIVNVSADVAVVSPGQAALISWDSTNATSCTDGNGNALRLNGSLSITPQETYTMDVVCTNPKGTSIQSITVEVTTTPIISLTASPLSVKSGDQAIISWTSLNTTRCVDGSGKTLRLSGSLTVSPQKAYTFDMSCSGPNGTAKKSITIGIIAPSTTGPTDKYVYVFKWKADAKASTPFQTSTFQTNDGCSSAQKASTGFEKTECIRVAVGTTTSGTSTGGGSSTGNNNNYNYDNSEAELQAAADAAAKKAAEDAAKRAAADAAAAAAVEEANNVTTEFGAGTVGPKVTLTLDPQIVGLGETSTLTWEIKDADTCNVQTYDGDVIVVDGTRKVRIERGNKFIIPDDVPMSGSYKLQMNGSFSSVRFQFICTGNGVTTNNPIPSKTLRWDTESGTFTGPATIDDLEAKPEAIAEAAVGAFSEVSWVAYNAISCRVSADAYAELYNETEGKWVSLKGSSASAPTTGVVRVKPGYEGSQVPYHCTQVTSTCDNADGWCSPTTRNVCTGDGGRMTTPTFIGLSSINQGDNSPAVVTVSCHGPIAPDPRPKSVTVTITPTPSSGGGGW